MFFISVSAPRQYKQVATKHAAPRKGCFHTRACSISECQDSCARRNHHVASPFAACSAGGAASSAAAPSCCCCCSPVASTGPSSSAVQDERHETPRHASTDAERQHAAPALGQVKVPACKDAAGAAPPGAPPALRFLLASPRFLAFSLVSTLYAARHEAIESRNQPVSCRRADPALHTIRSRPEHSRAGRCQRQGPLQGRCASPSSAALSGSTSSPKSRSSRAVSTSSADRVWRLASRHASLAVEVR